jgi:hypothetical protein
METIVVERILDRPLTVEGLRELSEQSRWCLDQHRVDIRSTFLALTGERTVCVYAAPDAESVRAVNRQVGVPLVRLWTASVHAAPTAPSAAPAKPFVVVERSFAEPAVLGDLQAMEDRGAWCLDLNGVRFLHTYLSLDRLRMVCVYEAPDAEAVRRTQKQLAMPFDDVWAATLYEYRRA